MKKILIISLAILVNMAYSQLQPTATLKIGTIYDSLPGIVEVPVTVEEINNPIIGINRIISWAFYIAYDVNVLYAGEPGNIVTLVNHNPQINLSGYLTQIIAQNPAPGWNTLAIIFSEIWQGCTMNPGDKFFDIQFTYTEGLTEEPNIIWTSSPNGFETNMADDEGNEYILTLIDGYVGPNPIAISELKTETIKIWSENGNISFNTETGGEFILFSLYGQQVMSTRVHPGLNIIPVKDKNAYYLIRVVTSSSTLTQKIFIQ